jgi:hypothetical protein
LNYTLQIQFDSSKVWLFYNDKLLNVICRKNQLRQVYKTFEQVFYHVLLQRAGRIGEGGFRIKTCSIKLPFVNAYHPPTVPNMTLKVTSNYIKFSVKTSILKKNPSMF